MIKGHTKIELKDEVTGEVKTVEQDNMLTNALAELAKPIGGINGLSSHLYENSPYNVVQSLFGGLMLFEEPLSSDPDDYIWPFSNPCTGFASNFAYSGVNTKLGGYNIAESGLQDDGSYKHVWDFSTDSGNGTISSLGLTSVYSARIGLGSLMYNFGVTVPIDVFFSDEEIVASVKDKTFKPLFVQNGFLYFVPMSNFTGESNVYNNGGVFTIKRTKIPIDSVSLNTAYNELISENIEIQLPTDFVSQFDTTVSESFMSVEYKNGVTTLAYMRNSISAGATLVLCHIDSNNNFSTTTTTFTNTIGEQIYYGLYNYRSNFKPMHDYCIAIGNNSKCMYVINTNDCTDVKRVQLLNGDTITVQESMLGTMYTDATSAAVVIGSSNTGNYTSYVLFINLKTGKASYGVARGTVSFSSGVVATNRKNLIGVSLYVNSYVNYFYVFINPFFLTTKNNLSEPVTKTATQSMKITYTLREE